MRVSIPPLLLVAALAATACQERPTSPRSLSVSTSVASDRAPGDTPNYNLEVILTDVACFSGSDPATLCPSLGHVKFREPKNDDFARRVYLDVWVRDLDPNTSYQLQRATDTNLDDVCTGTNWLTLGEGSQPHSIVTDVKGTGRAELFRDLSAFPAGTTFDIRFRVIQENSNPAVVVLMSDCYQFTVR